MTPRDRLAALYCAPPSSYFLSGALDLLGEIIGEHEQLAERVELIERALTDLAEAKYGSNNMGFARLIGELIGRVGALEDEFSEHKHGRGLSEFTGVPVRRQPRRLARRNYHGPGAVG